MQQAVAGVFHLYFGDGRRHPIICNYRRCLPDLPQRFVLQIVADGKIRRFFQVVRELLRIRRQTDWALHCHDCVSGCLGCLLWHGRVIYDSHEIYASFARNPLASWVIRRMEKFAIAHSEVVIFPSKYRSEYYELNGRDIKIIENRYFPHEASGGERQAIDNPQVFVYLGTFTRPRAIDAIIEAFRTETLRHERLVMAGRHTDYLETLLRDAPGNVEFIGDLEHKDATRVLREAKAGFALYRPIDENNKRCAPTKIFEHIYYGVPVIANRSPYIDELRSRPGGRCIHAIDEISAEAIAVACIQIGKGRVAPEPEVQFEASWDSQLSVVKSLYN